VNDYPKISREKITDADRVYPGDGIAPLADVFKTLKTIGYNRLLECRTLQQRVLEAGRRPGREDGPGEVEETDGVRAHNLRYFYP